MWLSEAQKLWGNFQVADSMATDGRQNPPGRGKAIVALIQPLLVLRVPGDRACPWGMLVPKFPVVVPRPQDPCGEPHLQGW